MKYLKFLSIAFALAAGTCLPAATVLTTGSWDGVGKNLNDYFATWGVSNDPNYVNTGQMTNDMYWNSYLTTGDAAIMLLEVAGNANQNSFGIFQVDGQGNKTYSQIFTGPDTAGAAATLTLPTGAFGFYLKFAGNGTYYYSDPALNTAIGGYDQLASYQGPVGGTTHIGGQLWDQQSYLLAWEDLPYASSDKDYNDMVLMIRVQTHTDQHHTPDNGSTALLIGSGLLTLVGLRRKLR